MHIDPKNLNTHQRLQLIRSAEAVLKREPNNIDATINIGMLLLSDGKYIPAIDYLRKALSKRKKDIIILNALGKCYFESKNFTEAIKIRRKLCDLDSRNPHFLSDYFEALKHAGKTQKSLLVLEKIKKIVPDDVDVDYKIADILRSEGKYDESNAVLSKIHEIKPGHPESLYLYCNSKKFNEEETRELIPHIDKALSKAEDKKQRCNLNYAAGKILQDTGQYDDAFLRFKTANDSRLKELNKSFPATFEKLKSVFSSNYIRQRSEFGLSGKNPIFIMGMPRSGTTLTESLCGAHSAITAGDELIFMSSILRSLGLQSSSKEIFKNMMSQYAQADFLAMAKDYLSYARSIVGNIDRFTDKLPHNFQSVGLIRILFPDAKIIHCRRHPIDNCLSIYTNSMRATHIAYKSDLTTLGLYYRQYWQLMQHWRENLDEPFHDVFYEDLVANTELNARAMIEHVGLEWEEGVMNREGSQKSIKTLSAWQARQPIYQSSKGRWRHYEKHLGPLIDALGPIVDDYEAELKALSKTQ